MPPALSAPNAEPMMTISTNALPLQLAAAADQQQSQRASATLPAETSSFSATLTRQLAQRQREQHQKDIELTQPGAPMPAVPEQQVPAPTDNSVASADQQDGATQQTPAAAPQPVSEASSEADEVAVKPDDSDDAARAADARVTDDMLALVASFQQLTPAVAVQQRPLVAVHASSAAIAASDLSEDISSAMAVPDDAGALRAGAEIEGGTPGKAVASATAESPRARNDFAAQLQERVQTAALSKAPAADSTVVNSLQAQTNAFQSAQSLTQALATAQPERLSARVGSPAWDQQVGQKVVWMIAGADQSATLELNPPDLGPLQVVLKVSNEMASVSFSAQQLEVRQALENALPRLREMLQESGIALGNADVNDGSAAQQGQAEQRAHRTAGGSARSSQSGTEDAGGAVAPRQRSRIIGGAGAVDTFA